MQEAKDFGEECDSLAAILMDAPENDLQRITLFKDWTIEDVTGHLHMWNHAASITLESREKFQDFFKFVMERMGAGDNHPQMQRQWLDQTKKGLSGKALFEAWHSFYPKLTERYANTNPETRLAWAGPDMSAQSKIIARQMETWAHGQEVFDVLGITRVDTDRIRNIAHLGVTTYSWTFRNRGETPPKPKPYIRLNAPSGTIWEWNEPQDANQVTGNATEFCQVVTQTRNIDDTTIKMVGDSAISWMSIAQCFAGAPNEPPAKGMRHKV